MTPTELHKTRIERKLTQRQLAKLLSVNIRTAQRYESGELEIPEWVIKILDLSKKTENNTK